MPATRSRSRSRYDDAGRGRAHVPRHHGQLRRARHHRPCRRAGGRAGVHPADGWRRRSRAVADVRRLLNAGADKVSMNTAAVQNPQFVADAAARSARSASWSRSMPRRVQGRRPLGGVHPRRPQARPAWMRSNGRAGAGGWAPARSCSPAWTATALKIGFDLELTRAFSDALDVPVIASGGVGTLEHLADGVQLGHADAVLAASIFHYGEHTVGEAKALHARRAASRCV
jgi:cyclase